MKSITLASYAKVNLSLDVGDVMDNGYHPVDMIMCQVLLHDVVQITIFQRDEKIDESDLLECQNRSMPQIEISANWPFVPCDDRNICHRAVIIFVEKFLETDRLKNKFHKIPYRVEIVLKKRVPVGAGLGGGSGNAAAVLHGLNALLGTHFSMRELMNLGAELGADVPFAVMNQAKSCKSVPAYLRNDKLACVCARATGIGTNLSPVRIPPRDIILVKPPFGVSTKDVYNGIDSCVIEKRPNNDELVSILEELSQLGVSQQELSQPEFSQHELSQLDSEAEIDKFDKTIITGHTKSGGKQINRGLGIDKKSDELWDKAYEQMINVLENYTVQNSKILQSLKKRLETAGETRHTMMSGSGPTIFAILDDVNRQKIYYLKNKLKFKGNEVIVTEILDGRSSGIAQKKKRGLQK